MELKKEKEERRERVKQERREEWTTSTSSYVAIYQHYRRPLLLELEPVPDSVSGTVGQRAAAQYRRHSPERCEQEKRPHPIRMHSVDSPELPFGCLMQHPATKRAATRFLHHSIGGSATR